MIRVENTSTSLNGIIKQPFKWVEIPVEKFNEVAIPQNVKLLNQYRTNIHKYQKLQDWKAVQREQINASRVVKQLGALLNEMDTLRLQVIDSDQKLFDNKINKSRKIALSALQEYLDVANKPPPPPDLEEEENRYSYDDEEEKKIQKLINMGELAEECQQQAAVADKWEELQTEIQDVHTLFNDFASLVHNQGESVDRVEHNVEVALDNVVEGNRYLAQAARLKSGMYPLAGAVIGTCIGGPVGLVAGIKIGGLAAVGCSILGYTGGKILKTQEETQKVPINSIQSVPDSASSEKV